jgi:hypothetical protein
MEEENDMKIKNNLETIESNSMNQSFNFLETLMRKKIHK